MKIALTGKGGVGKTTITAGLARYFADKGNQVLAVDADPDANLGLALGMSEEDIAEITPISERSDLVEERTGATRGTFGSMFKMNPKVSDIPEKYSKEHEGVKLLTMGTVDTGGSGCVCPEHVMLKMLMNHLVLFEKDVVIMDMEAGIEHLGRGTAQAVDAFIVVVEPGARSIQTFHKISKLAGDIGVRRVYAIGNKIRDRKDEDFLNEKIGADNILGFIPYSADIADSDRAGHSPYETETLKKVIGQIGEKIEAMSKS
ncbi:MAG: AAA family ATPase [Eubacteriaceae bacterium]|jgi:CO dehydrogenase maturation factor